MSESIKMSHLDNMLILLDAAKKIGCKVNLGKSGIIVLVDGINALNKRIAELEVENERLQDAWFRDETICPDGSLRPKVSDLLNRIAELEAEVTKHHELQDSYCDRIAKMEGLVDELIEAGERMSLAVECENQIEANAYYSWKELVKDWKERER